MTVALYGIATCDSVKRARAWLEANGFAYRFHDFKREGVDPARLASWAASAGWEVLLNRRGTTWRRRAESERGIATPEAAVALMAAHPSLMKRPVAEHGGGLLVGFDAARWTAALA